MAISKNPAETYSAQETSVARKKFVLAAFDTDIVDPDTGKRLTARALQVNAPGTVQVVDPYGNVAPELVGAEGRLILGACNGVQALNTDVSASDITVHI